MPQARFLDPLFSVEGLILDTEYSRNIQTVLLQPDACFLLGQYLCKTTGWKRVFGIQNILPCKENQQAEKELENLRHQRRHLPPTGKSWIPERKAGQALRVCPAVRSLVVDQFQELVREEGLGLPDPSDRARGHP